MITVELFDQRVTALWASQQSMAREKRWKSGKRAGMTRVPQQPIQFTKKELRQALWERVGLNAMPCPYCGVPIDILSLTLDHCTPRSLGGEFTIANMDVTCKDCNARKSDMTHEGFSALLEFSKSLSAWDRDKLMKRLKDANAGSRQRFFRPKAAQASIPGPAGNNVDPATNRSKSSQSNFLKNLGTPWDPDF